MQRKRLWCEKLELCFCSKETGEEEEEDEDEEDEFEENVSGAMPRQRSAKRQGHVSPNAESWLVELAELALKSSPNPVPSTHAHTLPQYTPFGVCLFRPQIRFFFFCCVFFFVLVVISWFLRVFFRSNRFVHSLVRFLRARTIHTHN